MLSSGIIKGGSLSNALVFDDDKLINSEMSRYFILIYH